MTRVYAVIASWTPWMVVSRSATIWEIDTFMTLLSRTITNCAAARIATAVQRPMGVPFQSPEGGLARRATTVGDARRRSIR